MSSSVRTARSVPHDTPEPVQKPVAALTPRQREILRLIAGGFTSRQIAETLSIHVKTVESHRTQLMKRLGIHNVAGLVRYAIQQGLVGTSDQ